MLFVNECQNAEGISLFSVHVQNNALKNCMWLPNAYKSIAKITNRYFFFLRFIAETTCE